MRRWLRCATASDWVSAPGFLAGISRRERKGALWELGLRSWEGHAAGGVRPGLVHSEAPGDGELKGASIDSAAVIIRVMKSSRNRDSTGGSRTTEWKWVLGEEGWGVPGDLRVGWGRGQRRRFCPRQWRRPGGDEGRAELRRAVQFARWAQREGAFCLFAPAL
jgi:hypothetical protein